MKVLGAQKLDRRVFATSRLAEFTSVKELTAQTGHTPDQWPQVIAKELVDNALGAAESAGIAPEIALQVDPCRIAVTDNGNGIAPETVASILDYTVRASDKEAYVSPTRGAQGNALKTVLAMPFALDGGRGLTVIESRGVRHIITFGMDPVRREPRIEHVTAESLVKAGTRVAVYFPLSPWSEDDPTGSRLLQVGRDFAALNPHLSLKMPGASSARSDASFRKWTPADLIPACWYRDDRFDRLLAAHIADDQDHGRGTKVREFIATFRGMSATARQKSVLECTGTARMSLSDFYANGHNPDAVRQLLGAPRFQVFGQRECSPRTALLSPLAPKLRFGAASPASKAVSISGAAGKERASGHNDNKTHNRADQAQPSENAPQRALSDTGRRL